MASITLKRGTREEIENTSVSDGQLLIETDQGSYNKIYIDTENNERVVAGGGGSNVEWNQIQTDGDKIAEVTIDGTKTDVYAPTGGGGSNVEWNQIQTDGDKIAEVTIDGTKTDVYAPTGGGSFSSEILYTATGTSRTEIELSRPYTDFDYLDITILKYDDGSYYDFMHTFIDCAQQADIMNNNLFTGRTNTNFIDVWAKANSFMRYKFTDATHITYPTHGAEVGANGANTIFQVKGIKF